MISAQALIDFNPINNMKTNRSNNRSLKQNSNRLAAYLATGIGAGLVATPQADAAIITIDLASPFYFLGMHLTQPTTICRV